MHIDLRMVDTSDFVIAFCPTNIYSVGTPHEIVVARQKKKPVLFVSPPVEFPALAKLRQLLRGNAEAMKVLKELEADVPIKPNPEPLPSLWYMALIDSESFFDGFGFHEYKESYRWERSHFDDLEHRRRPRRPLLPFPERLAHGEFPQEWDRHSGAWKRNEDWMLWETTPAREGAEVTTVHIRRGARRRARRHGRGVAADGRRCAHCYAGRKGPNLSSSMPLARSRSSGTTLLFAITRNVPNSVDH
jgi:hypothetical protein